MSNTSQSEYKKLSPGEAYSLLKADIEKLAAAAEKRFDKIDASHTVLLNKQNEHDKEIFGLKLRSGVIGSVSGLLGGLLGSVGIKIS